MIKISVPGFKNLKLIHLVMDYNGTLACDGNLLEGVRQKLNDLSKQINIHVLTADTFGKAASELSGISCELTVLPKENQEIGKLRYIEQIGSQETVCIGNGRNDRLMLKESALGIVVIQEEGSAVETIVAADIVSPDIASALDLLINPLRLVATLRS